MPKSAPLPADRKVGQNIRRYRLEANMSQTDLANELNLTFQQVQKYEKGTNRVGAGRLITIARFLGCTTQQLLGDEAEPGRLMPDLLREQGQSKMGLELARAFSFITSPDHRETLVKVARAMAGENLRRPPITRRTAVRQDTAPQSAVGSGSHPPTQTHAPNAARPTLRASSRARPAS